MKKRLESFVKDAKLWFTGDKDDLKDMNTINAVLLDTLELGLCISAATNALYKNKKIFALHVPFILDYMTRYFRQIDIEYETDDYKHDKTRLYKIPGIIGTYKEIMKRKRANLNTK